MAAAFACFRFWPEDAPSEVLLEQAREALTAKDYAAAEEFCLRVIIRHGPSVPALLVAGEAATKQGRLTEALGYYAQLPDSGGKEAALGFAAAGDILIHQHHASAAETQLRRALALDPELLFAHDRLAYLLGIEGRRWESLPHLFELLRAGQGSMETLLLLGNRQAVLEPSGELEQFRQADPDDPMPLIGEARLAAGRTQIEEAKRLLKEVLEKDPRQIEAQAELGKLLLANADPELAQWLAEGSLVAEDHPEVWTTRGLWAKQRGDEKGAARCYWEALQRDPGHLAATYQLAVTLEALGDSEAGRRLSERAARLQKLCGVLDLLFDDRQHLGLLRSAAELTESLGSVWEAWGWYRVILTVDPQASGAQEGLQRLQAELQSGPPLVLDAANPAKQFDLSSFDLPRWDAGLSSLQASQPALPKYRASFANLASQAGIDFRYFAGSDSFADGRRMYQFTGGGVAVLDYDADGWPDIYLTQGCRWPAKPGQTEFLDRLYRNRGDGTFEDVTERSLLAEDRFSQGVAAGDFNNDGFADLYVANIGGNRLYVNQGDGTFRDETAAAGIAGETWTTSCLLADLNGDGLADLYDVNYVQGDDVYERTCNQNGRRRACSPTIFASQADRCYLNLGDGRFAEQTAAGLGVSGGNGLGAVAADFDGSGRLSLFVANDQDANFYFVNGTTRPEGAPKFVEQGVLFGLAFDAEGKAQACMGVAAGDVNDDGRLDLFVTNFYQESNTLYVQDESGLFADATAASGLRGPSYEMLGFGAQFIDGELDGYQDLVIANGHIDDFTHQQIPYQMPPQYFRGLGAGKFAERRATELGEYFQGKYLGRGLARLDWNRDGREDFVVSHLDAPAALVANTSTETGHYLVVQLRGVKSSRDAIGAVVMVECAGRRRTQWLTAGDGYQASNQKQLVFGLGSEKRADKLRIRWPSGLMQEFADLAGDQTLILVEGASLPSRMPPPR